jgi:predicted Fe-S protein YdhL (DUF1289 family)
VKLTHSTTMTQIEIVSPCQRKCSLDINTEYCNSCKRTLVEIECWSIYTNEEKLEIIVQLKGR